MYKKCIRIPNTKKIICLVFCCLVISLCVLCCFSLHGKSPAVCACVKTSLSSVLSWLVKCKSICSLNGSLIEPHISLLSMNLRNLRNKNKKKISKTFISYQTSTSGGLPLPLAQPIGVHSSSLEAGDAKTSCETIRTIARGGKRAWHWKQLLVFPLAFRTYLSSSAVPIAWGLRSLESKL